jgi:hypothetical protein
MKNPATAPRAASPRHFSLLWVAAYIAWMAALAGGMMYARRQAIALYGSPAAQSEWDTWRADAQKLAAGAGPVRRRAPRSAEPPALVLMRDHFGVCLSLVLVLNSVLFATLVLLVRGALRGTNSARL